MPVLEEWTLNLKPEDVLRAQGANPEQMQQHRPIVWEIAEWAVRESTPLLRPQVLYQEFKVKSVTHERLELDSNEFPSRDRFFISGRLVAEHLIGAEVVIAVLCTIGSLLEDIASQLMQEDPLRGLALDASGSAAAELLATLASHHFEQQALTRGWQTSMPLNPGMIGWPVQQGQPQIFNLLAGELKRHPEFKVSLNESYLMRPRKTVSLALGMGKNMNPQGRICDFCTLRETCRYQNHYPSTT